MNKFQPVLEVLRQKSKTEFEKAFENELDKQIDLKYFIDLLKLKFNFDCEQEIVLLFKQIDCYCKGSITVEALIKYLEEYEKIRLTRSDGPFEQVPTLYHGVRCQDCIIEWIYYPKIPNVLDEIAGHYISLSRNGLVIIWSTDMKKRFEATIETADDGERKSTWATSLTCLPKEKLLAVATTSGDIRFFRSSIYKFEHKFSFVCFPYIIYRLSCYDSRKLVCGDFNGYCFIINLSEDFFTRIRRKTSHIFPEKMNFFSLTKGKVPGTSYERTSKQHYGSVQKVEYIPSLNAIISCSVNTKRAMLVHYLDRNESLSFAAPGGFYSFAFCQKLSWIVTGGVDSSIKLWNPTVNASCNETLTAHTSAVTDVLIHEERLLLLSIDREKIIRVWDMIRPACLQVISSKESDFPENQSFATAFLDMETDALIVTTYRVGRLEILRTGYRQLTHPQSELILLAAYSPDFNCIVTVGNDSSAAVWDASSGSLVNEFHHLHEQVDEFGTSRRIDTTSAGLDPSGRRLITSGRNGCVKVWNYHLGICIKSFQANCVVLSMNFTGYHIYAAGSSKRIIDFYDNGKDEVEDVIWEAKHSRSILSISFYRRLLLACASCEGNITIWHRKSVDLKLRLTDTTITDEVEEPINEGYRAKAMVRQMQSKGISEILFLEARELDFSIANLVSCGIDGNIRFWNIVCTRKANEGKLVSKFRAVFRDCDGILCISTDKDNHYLVSGDTMGYIRVYSLDNYYNMSEEEKEEMQNETDFVDNVATAEQLRRFPFLRMHDIISTRFPSASKFLDEKDAEIGHSPLLLNCFRGHLKAIFKITFVNEKELLITAGREGSVRLWTLEGIFIGRLGCTGSIWNSPSSENQKNSLPPDVRLTASATTLFVLNNGANPKWKIALDALRRCRLWNPLEKYPEKPFRWNKRVPGFADLNEDDSLTEFLAMQLPKYPGIESQKYELPLKFNVKDFQ